MRKEERSKLRKAFERHLKKKQKKTHTHTRSTRLWLIPATATAKARRLGAELWWARKLADQSGAATGKEMAKAAALATANNHRQRRKQTKMLVRCADIKTFQKHAYRGGEL
jgi:ABC-type Zn2+ transport system substrate-binding protein/surface adhesin